MKGVWLNVPGHVGELHAAQDLIILGALTPAANVRRH
jgi:hypothetical protein